MSEVKKVNVGGINYDIASDLIDNLNSTAADKALSAKQGNILAKIASQNMETSSTAAYLHEKDTYFNYNGKYYITTVQINAGSTITPGTNCEVTDIGAELSSLNTALNDLDSYTKANKIETKTSISLHTDSDTLVPSDGYLALSAVNAGSYINVAYFGSDKAKNGSFGCYATSNSRIYHSLYLRKGMYLRLLGANGSYTADWLPFT